MLEWRHKAVSSLVMWLQSKFNICWHRHNEGSFHAGFVARWHQDVTFLSAVQLKCLADLVPWDEFKRFVVQDVFLFHLSRSGEHVEPDHATNQISSHGLLPYFVWTTQSYLHIRQLILIQIQLQTVLRILRPSARVFILHELLVVKMAATGDFVFVLRVPLAGQHDVFGFR